MSVAQLHGILRERVIIVIELAVYADESGIHDPHGKEPGSEVASIGGYIATKKQWKTFAQRWNTALRKYKVPHFHMSEFNRRKQKPCSPYFGWSDVKKRRFLRLLIKIAHDNTLYGYASMVETEAWDTILDDAAKLGIPKGEKDTIYNPYVNCLQNFFAKFPKFLKKEIDPLVNRGKPIEKVAFVFGQHEVFSCAAHIGYNAVHKNERLNPEHRFGTLSFGSPIDYPPLQAADLFAFYSRRRFTRFLKKIAIDEFEQALLDPAKVCLLHLNRENLKNLREKLQAKRAERNR